jgi:hypothetical protein
MEAHTVEHGDPGFRLERRALIEWAQFPVDLLRTGKLSGQRPYHHYGELKALGLVDSHYLYVTLRKGPVRVFVLVDSSVMQKPQEAIEQVQPQEFTVPMGDHSVVVVGLKGINQLRENRKVAGGVLILYCASERFEGEKTIEIVRRSKIEALPFSYGRNIFSPMT